MKINEKFKDFDGRMAWEHVVRHVENHDTITTVTGITLNVHFVGSCIFIKGGTPGTKRAEKGEYLTGRDLYLHMTRSEDGKTFIPGMSSRTSKDSRHRSLLCFTVREFSNNY